ncbi:MAG: M1 family metallopeptidase [Chitinophagaceae bacterium]|nr:M1 family metallopeptidase [Chitinophagaceae bacterium]
MNRRLIIIVLLFQQLTLSAQKNILPDALVGEYQADLNFPIVVRVLKNGDKLVLNIVGQGTVELTPLRGNNFRPNGIKPEVNLECLKDSLGRIEKLRWTQKASSSRWIRLAANTDTHAGKYRMKDNPYRLLLITEEQGGLKVSLPGRQVLFMSPLGNGHYTAKKDGEIYRLDITKDDLTLTGYPPVDFIKVSSMLPHPSDRANGFTHADSLQGMLTPLRTCYDVLFYDLDIAVQPERKSISGTNVIRFKALRTFDRMQIDLFANMHIKKIVFHDRELSYTREDNAVFIQWPQPVQAGSQEEITVHYEGTPREPEIDMNKGGWFWLWNRGGTMWIETVSQGVGASLWWPCKDHLSDRPDSMKISVTFPSGLKEISNGRLLRETVLPGGQTRCDWYVSYPINTYNVVVNIGDYAHFQDTCVEGRDTLVLQYYCLSYNQAIAKNIFSRVKPMLRLYRQRFGPYPFAGDGFTLMESIYPMEHQGAVSIGAINNPFNSTKYDSVDLTRLIWHESAHEWWGNSVGCRDYADMWIHESFATYAEVLSYEAAEGRQAALNYLHSQTPENKEPIIGVYDVNHFHMGDMYPKGALMLHTLRNIIDNDSLWFNILRGIQQHFRYSTITTEDITGYISSAAGKDLSYFFDQYLRYPSIPVLMYSLEQNGSSLKVSYKWQADRPGFCMPVKWAASRGKFEFVYPRTDWQTMELKGMDRKDFKVDTDNFYIRMKEVTLQR